MFTLSSQWTLVLRPRWNRGFRRRTAVPRRAPAAIRSARAEVRRRSGGGSAGGAGGELRGRGQAALGGARAGAEAALGDVLERRAQLVQEHRQAGEAVGVDGPGQAARAPGA